VTFLANLRGEIREKCHARDIFGESKG